MNVQLHGWRAGLLTISLIHLVRTAKGQGLTAAKRDVEGLVDGRAIDVHFDDPGAATAFLRAAEAVGAIGSLRDVNAE